jgi:hypothetical protein
MASPPDGAVQRHRRLVEDEGRRRPLQGEAQGDESAVGVAQPDRVGTSEVEDGGDVLLFALDAVVGVAAAGAVAAAADRVGGQVRCEDSGQGLPVLDRVQGSGGDHERTSPAGDGDGDLRAVGRGDAGLPGVCVGRGPVPVTSIRGTHRFEVRVG